jgi:hypothetical protein
MRVRRREVRFPTQDEHERRKNGVGVARPGADTDAEFRDLSQDQIQEFLRSSEPIDFTTGGRAERYQWVERVLAAQNYWKLRKRERGLVRAYVRKVTGLGEAQTSRLIRAFRDQGVVRAGVSTAQIHRQVQGGRRCVVGGSGSGAWAFERPRHAADFTARVRAVRRAVVRASWPGTGATRESRYLR